MLADVWLEGPPTALTYGVPPALVSAGLAVGMAVRVPLGRRRATGYVAALHDRMPEGFAPKPIEAIDDHRPMLPEALLALVDFAARYYRAPVGDMLAAALPERARVRPEALALTDAGRARAAESAPVSAPAARGRRRQATTLEDVLAWGSRQPRGFTATGLCRALGGERAAALRLLRRLRSLGLAAPLTRRAAAPKREAWLRRCSTEPLALPSRQRRAHRLWALLPEDGRPVAAKALEAALPRALEAARTLVKRRLVEVQLAEVRKSPWDASAESLAGSAGRVPPAPSPGQQEALLRLAAAVDAERFEVALLFGVTGSGKTEVYLQAIERVLAAGRTALVLVPEIALTPQLGARFRARFGDQVATFHSGLSAAERRDEWQRVFDGHARIGLGARSAVFLPLERLGIVVVDEEHEASFKQEDPPHYHARDLAIWRGRHAQAVVVLGSATPSLESWHNATSGRYRLLSLPTRASGQPLAAVARVDLKASPPEGDTLLSPPLLAALDEVLARGEQAILFLNRRGFAPYVFCRDCAHPFRCQHCEVALTLHRTRAALVCHYCGHQEAPPDMCPMCQGRRVGAFGPGTERLEDEVRNRFPDHPCVRLDRDKVRNRKELAAALDAFRQGRAKLMVGTQMVAKGHDFPNVTLVGVVSADASLNFPDFRAAERTFQLLTQVAGRAGRGQRAGRVLVQAFEPEHEAIVAAAQQDFAAFAKRELEQRRALGYPPFSRLAAVRVEGAVLEDVERHAAKVAEAARGDGVDIRGPAPAPLARLRGQWRFVLLLKSSSRAPLHAAALRIESMPRAPAGIRRTVDIDPQQML